MQLQLYHNVIEREICKKNKKQKFGSNISYSSLQWLFISILQTRIWWLREFNAMKKKKNEFPAYRLLLFSIDPIIKMPDTYTQLTSKRSYNISEAKLKRILEYNERLNEQLELPRIPVSEASAR